METVRLTRESKLLLSVVAGAVIGLVVAIMGFPVLAYYVLEPWFKWWMR